MSRRRKGQGQVGICQEGSEQGEEEWRRDQNSRGQTLWGLGGLPKELGVDLSGMEGRVSTKAGGI